VVYYDTIVERSTRLENLSKVRVSSENFNLIATKITLPEVYLSKSNKYSYKFIKSSFNVQIKSILCGSWHVCLANSAVIKRYIG